MPSELQLRKTARKLLAECIRLEKDEKLLVVTDYRPNRIADAIMAEARKITENIRCRKITKNRMPGSPVPEIKHDLIWADVVAAPTIRSISHSIETRVARKKYGARVVSMPGITEEMFVNSLNAAYAQQKKVHSKLIRILKKGRTVKINSENGTDFKIRVHRRKISPDDNACWKKGSLRNIPSGEVGYAPILSGTGKFVIDRWADVIKPSDKVSLIIKNGKIVGWSKNKKAKILIDTFRKAGPCAMKIVEFSFGTNPSIRKPIGNVLWDEKIYGSLHIAFGGWGYVRKCPIHIDVIILKPTVWVDGKLFLKGNKFI